MKARLLEQGFVVHVVDRNELRFKQLGSEQRARPVHLDEIHAIDGWRFDGSVNYLPGLLRDSLKLSWLTSKPGYRSALGMEAKLLDLAEQVRRRRNRIHLPIGGTFSRIDPEADSRHSSLFASLVNDHLIQQANRLIATHGLSIPQLAPL